MIDEKKCRLIIIFTNHPLSLTGNKATKVDIRQNIVRLKLKTDTKKHQSLQLMFSRIEYLKNYIKIVS
jgi:hypothetical protein